MIEPELRRFARAVARYVATHPIEIQFTSGRAYRGGPLAGIVITDFNAHPPGKGIGSAAMIFLQNLAADVDLSLYLTPSNSRSAAFYARHGFERGAGRFGQTHAWLCPLPAWFIHEERQAA